MYPSGNWRGYWEQEQVGRQTMRDLILNFDGGTVHGQGHDMVGLFTFRGSYDESGGVSLVKQYLGQHQVWYAGRYDGEGTIYGTWNIGPQWSGPFALFPDRQENVAEAPILEVAIPAREKSPFSF